MKNFSTIINDKDIITVEYQKNNSVLFSESQILTDDQKSQARSNIGAGTSDFDGTWDSLSGKPNIVQSTGQSTSDVMSQKAVTDELNKKANSADLANYVTTDTDQDIKGKKTVVPPLNKDNSNQIATTAWAGRRYKSIADFGFTSQTTVKAIVQKIIDNWYEYCTFACTNDNFNNFSDTPEGYGTLIIEVGSNALRPFISFTKQIGDSNSYKYWQANIVRGENNQISEIQWYEIINSNLPQTISGEKTFTSNIYISQTSGQNAGITWQSASDNTNRGIFRHYDDGTTETFVTQSGGFLFRPLNNNNTKSIKVDPAVGALYPEQNSGADLGKTAQRWNAVYAGKTGVRSTGNIICDSKVISYSAVESNKEVPDFNGILKDDLYTTAPTKTRGAQYLARDKNGAYIGGLRIYHDTNGTIQSQLLCRSQNTDVQNYVYFQAQPSATSNADKNKFAFIPHTNGNIDLGLSNNKWNNGYITNLQNCKVINGGGGNSLIQQNSDTPDADITVGSTNCALKIIGKYARPEYKQGKNGTYANLALMSDINNGILTILKNGGSLGSFSANQSADVDIDIDVPENLSELTNDIKAITNTTDTTNSWAFGGGGNTVVANSTANSCVAIGSGSQTRYQKSIRIGTALGQTPKDQSVTQIGVNNYTSSGRALYLGAGYTGFTYMNAAGSSWTSASDIRDKTDIKEIDHALDFIKKLKPITYVMNDRERYLIRDEDDNPILDENGKQQYDVEAHKRGDKKKHRRFAGLSAQDTYQAMLDCYNNDTNYAQIVDNNKFDHPDDEYLEQYSMSYERLVPFLIKAVQEQQVQIEKLKSKLGE